jgi:hypothetical protein
MTKVGHLLCRAGIHKWAEWTHHMKTPLVPITGLDDILFDDENLLIETHTRTCERCGKGEVKNVLHW